MGLITAHVLIMTLGVKLHIYRHDKSRISSYIRFFDSVNYPWPLLSVRWLIGRLVRKLVCLSWFLKGRDVIFFCIIFTSISSCIGRTLTNLHHLPFSLPRPFIVSLQHFDCTWCNCFVAGTWRSSAWSSAPSSSSTSASSTGHSHASTGTFRTR